MRKKEILKKANDLIKGANFTKLIATKLIATSKRDKSALYLVVAMNDKSAFYCSYTTDNSYYIDAANNKFLLK